VYQGEPVSFGEDPSLASTFSADAWQGEDSSSELPSLSQASSRVVAVLNRRLGFGVRNHSSSRRGYDMLRREELAALEAEFEGKPAWVVYHTAN
jgi:hypothetical protein